MEATECVNGELPKNDTKIHSGSFTGATNQQFTLVDLEAGNVGSALSEGNMTLIVGIAAAVVFGLGGFFLGTKKKKPALAGAAENDDE